MLNISKTVSSVDCWRETSEKVPDAGNNMRDVGGGGRWGENISLSGGGRRNPDADRGGVLFGVARRKEGFWGGVEKRKRRNGWKR